MRINYHVLPQIFQSNSLIGQDRIHKSFTSLTTMGKPKVSDNPGVKSKKGRSLENHDKKSVKAQPKKPATFNAEEILSLLSKRKAKSTSSKPKKGRVLKINFALPPTCSFLVQTPSPDPSVATFEGPGVSIKVPLKKGSTSGKTEKTKKDAPKLVKAPKKPY